MASAAMQAAVAMMRENAGVGGADMTLDERRRAMEEGVSFPTPDDVVVTSVDIDGIPGCWVEAPGAGGRVVLYFHGGGYVMGSLDTHRELMARLSRACGARVLGVDYRLAPEHVFPAAVDDGVRSYRWLLEQGVGAGQIVVGGDSAGGGLTYATLVSLRDAGDPLPACAFTFSPWTDLTGSGASVATRADADPMIEPGALLAIAGTYHGSADAADPLVSPLFADLAGLPPQLVQVGDAEVLLDDANRIVERCRDVGVVVESRTWDGAFHVFQAYPDLPESVEAISDVADFVSRHGG